LYEFSLTFFMDIFYELLKNNKELEKIPEIELEKRR
jgi:hypothetical protein